MDEFDDLAARLERSLLPDDTLPGPHSPEAERAIRAAIAHRQRRRQRRRVGVLTVGMALLTAATFVYFGTRTDPFVVACFDAPDTEASRAVPPDTSDPIEGCADLWEAGALTHPAVQAGTIPDLFACVGNGATWVFPSIDGETCVDLDLPAPDPDQDVTPLTELERRLAEMYPIESCVPPAEALGEIRSLLDELGLADWSAELAMDPERLPCTSIAIDGASTTVFVVPGAPRQ